MATDEELDTQTTLANWRTAPYSRRSFHHVDELIRVDTIEASDRPGSLKTGPELDLGSVKLADGRSVEDALAASHTDAFLVLHDGVIVSERYDRLMRAGDRHIVFSVSKSVTGCLAGILVEEGVLDPGKPVTEYVRELEGSAWDDATVREVLDMTVSVRFVEDYLDPAGDVSRYRVAMDWNPPGDFPYEGGLHAFLPKLPKGEGPHGYRFHYVSPNSDVLGWVLEAASGRKIAELLSEKIWRRCGAEADGMITVDQMGGARTAGGICMRARDLARFGEVMRNEGRAGGEQVIPACWIEDIRRNGDRGAWECGGMTALYPTGSYRSQWYVPDTHPGALMAIGIHGQWVYVDLENRITAIKLSSQPLPEDSALDQLSLSIFKALGDHFGA
ncbi:serine hydrolase [Palleronia sp. LCG004]|uniref:serine hydrolase domain-containing protein n=1 Tax=Palleronia sp. LCG004 TaxID=3079304 RepID=UPI0029422EC6|nr:serine hydrolase [Palleronia sp. LCG004]WOI56576.1 serine hydrolase [Palleronia sp. LCG004]